jgi:hypothetical protein
MQGPLPVTPESLKLPVDIFLEPPLTRRTYCAASIPILAVLRERTVHSTG